jgi:hypothetical protein
MILEPHEQSESADQEYDADFFALLARLRWFGTCESHMWRIGGYRAKYARMRQYGLWLQQR